MTSVKCPHCHKWIGNMEVHEDCARKQDEARDEPEFASHCDVCSEAITKPGKCPDCRKSGASPCGPGNMSHGSMLAVMKSVYGK